MYLDAYVYMYLHEVISCRVNGFRLKCTVVRGKKFAAYIFACSCVRYFRFEIGSLVLWMMFRPFLSLLNSRPHCIFFLSFPSSSFSIYSWSIRRDPSDGVAEHVRGQEAELCHFGRNRRGRRQGRHSSGEMGPRTAIMNAMHEKHCW